MSGNDISLEELAWYYLNIESQDYRLIHVHHSITFKNNRPILCGTKSAAGVREVPIVKQLMEILESAENKEGYVIKNTRSPDMPMTEKTYQRSWERIKKKIDLHDATAHIFRHTFASIMEPHTDVKNIANHYGARGHPNNHEPLYA